jgi:nucleoid DNA-binding protein
MTKKDIVSHVSEKTELPQIIVQEVVQNTLDYIIELLAQDKTIELRNFGVFKTKMRSPRTGRNPKTGEKVAIPAKKKVTFKPGKIMKDQIG